MAKKTNARPPKGTRDFLPDDVQRREFVTRVIRDVYGAHGFLPLETPAFERLDALLGKYGDEGDQLVFKILHRGQPLVEGVRAAHAHIEAPGGIVVGRSGETAPAAETMLADMGLRYDLTVPLARVYAEYQGKLPAVFKRYQIQPVWRADTPGKGRFREFYQCDVDIVGASSLSVEVEVVGAVAECLRRLGFDDFKIRLNDRRLLRALVDRAGIDPALETAAIVAIDKLDKVGPDGVARELEAHGIGEDARSRLLAMVLGDDVSLATLRERLTDVDVRANVDVNGSGSGNGSDNGNGDGGAGDHDGRVGHAGHDGRAEGLAAIADLEQILAWAAHTPAAGHLMFSPTLARGLGYYTGAIFEIAVADLAGSLGGGGRYDGLIGTFLGRDVPACGFSIGLERILVVMEERGMFPGDTASIDVLLGAEAGVDEALALEVAYDLRAEGLRVDLQPGSVKSAKLRKAADERGIPAAATIAGSSPHDVSLWFKAEPDVRSRAVERSRVVAEICSVLKATGPSRSGAPVVP
ncbi:MAG: histidine--tRNA ligase [Deltaproteobacteria bacterium]|nr:histidine--tRNA ligase [Deltaproteobacteria bacterium]